MQIKLLCIVTHAHAEYNNIIAKKVALPVSLSSSENFFIDVFNHFLHTIYIIHGRTYTVLVLSTELFAV